MNNEFILNNELFAGGRKENSLHRKSVQRSSKRRIRQCLLASIKPVGEQEQKLTISSPPNVM